MQQQIQKLIKHSKHPEFIRQAFAFAQTSYAGKQYLDKEEYINHATRTALIISDMNPDEKIIVAALLHNVLNIENANQKNARFKEIENSFGKEVADISASISELNKLYDSISFSLKQTTTSDNERIENLKKMFFAIEKDVRAIVITLATRIDLLENMAHLSREDQKLQARQTLQIFAPVANRLGLGEIKRRLEDLSFAIIAPEEFTSLKEQVKEQYAQRQRYLKKCIPNLKKILKKEKIVCLDINYRAKSYWSTYQKLIRRNQDIKKIYDLIALRIIVPDIGACYKTLGIIHKYYWPISEEMQDYIAKPKPNGYRSLHTVVFLEKEKPDNTTPRISEIQIKTYQMHQEAEYGVCAHWSYKEKIDLKKEHSHLAWSEKIPQFHAGFKIDFFENQVFAFSPKGDIIVLPKNATPVDFAYAIHSQVGDHCEMAKINGKIVPLSQPLKNGDMVEIIINKKRQPSPDWLKFVKTNLAKSNIKKATATVIKHTIFSVPSFIKNKIVEASEKYIKPKKEKVKKEKPLQLHLAGQKYIFIHYAKCCNPKSSDPVKAYLTKYRSAVLHKISCENLQKLSHVFPEKVIEAYWK